MMAERGRSEGGARADRKTTTGTQNTHLEGGGEGVEAQLLVPHRHEGAVAALAQVHGRRLQRRPQGGCRADAERTRGGDWVGGGRVWGGQRADGGRAEARLERRQGAAVQAGPGAAGSGVQQVGADAGGAHLRTEGGTDRGGGHGGAGMGERAGAGGMGEQTSERTDERTGEGTWERPWERTGGAGMGADRGEGYGGW